jgi:hypothetical protein
MSSTVSTAEQSPIAGRPDRNAKWIPLIVLGTALLIFAPICRHAFVSWDDDYTIENNTRLQHPSMENMLHYWSHSFMDLYVPVTYTAWTGVAYVSKAVTHDGPADPRVFHAASILVHAFNALLVYLLLRRLLKKSWPAAAGAMLFALHPVQVETVAWASGFKDLLCAMFSLIALNQYVRAVDPNDAAGRRKLRHGIALLAMLMAMLSKPTAMVTPLLAVVIDLLILRRSWRQVIASSWPYFLLAVPCMVWTKLCQPASYLRQVPVWQRPLIAADALAFYLYKLLLPVRMTYDYGRSPWTIFEKHWAWFTWIVPAAIAVVLIIRRRRSQMLAASALLMVFGVLPVLGVTTFDFQMISTVSDHYLYLAILGPALAAAWVLTRLPKTNHWPALATCAVLALCALRSTDQMHYWQDSRTFFGHTLELNPRSWSAWYGLGYLNHMDGRALAARATAEATQGIDATADRAAANDCLQEAMDCYRHAVELNDFDLAAHHGYGAMLMYFGRYDDAGRQFVEVLRRRNSLAPSMRPNYYADTDFLGQCLFFVGRAEDAAAVFREAIALRPAPADAALHLRAAEAVLARRNAAHPAITDMHKEGAESATGGN